MYRRGLLALITKLLIIRFPQASCHFLPLTPKYTSQHPIRAHPLPKFSLNVRGEVAHSFKSHIKLQFCALSSSYFQTSDGRLRTEMQQATTKRDTTCLLSRQLQDARRQNLCAQLFTYSHHYDTLI